MELNHGSTGSKLEGAEERPTLSLGKERRFWKPTLNEFPGPLYQELSILSRVTRGHVSLGRLVKSLVYKAQCSQ